MKNKIIAIACGIGTTLGLLIGLTGCGPSARTVAMMQNPEITIINEIDDCVIKYVDRGDRERSFYLAKCSNTSTVTGEERVKTGKTSHYEKRTEITQQLEELTPEEKKALVRQQALKKLTPAERDALLAKDE